MSGEVAVEARDLGKRYGTHWILRHCSFLLPTGSVTALIGPNGTGKTTLLNMLVGLTISTEGDVRILDHSPREEPTAVLPRLGFVAQDHPLERGFKVAEMLTMGRKLNPGWDDDLALRTLRSLAIPLDRKVGQLSGGQQAQVALTMALAKRPNVLVLDEPVAALDPLARREFLQSLMEVAADGDLTILLSSHIIADLERVCDHILLLAGGNVQLAGPIDEIIASHRILTGARGDTTAIGRTHQIIQERQTDRQTTLLVRSSGHVYDACWQIADAPLEDIALAYLSRQQQRVQKELAS